MRFIKNLVRKKQFSLRIRPCAYNYNTRIVTAHCDAEMALDGDISLTVLNHDLEYKGYHHLEKSLNERIDSIRADAVYQTTKFGECEGLSYVQVTSHHLIELLLVVFFLMSYIVLVQRIAYIYVHLYLLYY